MKRTSLRVEFDKGQYEVLANLLTEIENKIEKGLSVDSEIEEFNKIGGKSSFYTVDDIVAYHSYTNEEDFIKALLLPEPYKVENITDDQVLEMLLMLSEERVESVFDYYLMVLEMSTNRENVLEVLDKSSGNLNAEVLVRLKEMVEDLLFDDGNDQPTVIHL
ncbi:hypothetical protein JMN32_18945 [Fulvivirga sp. 29W222]|uniref:Uncharacterized protein n=1 Tax=Fulvivirga marina TaxID=2494733 RepID=A0A937KDF1_9BACT|nr:hypothetical protein [Fulvivirga marina]MBL6448399.1 hypothetical protein [Fulvivirga marina]